MSEFFQFSRDILNFRFFIALSAIILLAKFLPSRWTKPARSVRFNVYLFLIIAAFSAMGTFLPQNKPEEVAAQWGPTLALLFERLGFLDVYHSWWFAFLLGLMAFNVIVCKLKKIAQDPFAEPETEGTLEVLPSAFFSKARFLKKKQSSERPDDLTARALVWAQQSGLSPTVRSVRVNDPKAGLRDGVAIFGGRQTFQRWGDALLHVSVVAILAGSLLGAMAGFDESVPVEEGKTVALKNKPWTVTLHDFDIERYPSTGAPSLYASDIEVKEGETSLGRKRIVVNDPFDIDGVRFYQASWGMTTDFERVRLFIGGKVIEARQGEIASVPNSPIRFRVNQILPGFDLDENRRVAISDFQGSNVALQIDFFTGEKLAGRIWALKDQPEVAFKMVGDQVEPTAAPPFRVAGIDPILFSGLQVGYDPGAPIFWVSSIVFLAGLALHFYFHQRRYRILIYEEEGGASVMFAGRSSRPPQDFQAEFDAVSRRFEQSLTLSA